MTCCRMVPRPSAPSVYPGTWVVHWPQRSVINRRLSRPIVRAEPMNQSGIARLVVFAWPLAAVSGRCQAVVRPTSTGRTLPGSAMTSVKLSHVPAMT